MFITHTEPMNAKNRTRRCDILSCLDGMTVCNTTHKRYGSLVNYLGQI